MFCAAGMLISDLKHDYVRTYARDLDKVVVQEVTRLYKEMTDTALKTLAGGRRGEEQGGRGVFGGPALRRPVQRGRGPVVGKGTIRNADLAKLVDQFHARHDALYGYSMKGRRSS